MYKVDPIGPRTPPVGNLPVNGAEGGTSAGAASAELPAGFTGGGTVLYNSDGDRADISGKALELWDNQNNQNVTPGASPDAPPAEGGSALDYRLQLPSPFLDWESVINGPNGPVDTTITTPQGTRLPDSMTPNTAPPVTSAPGGSPQNGGAPNIDTSSFEFSPIEPKGECKTCESRRYVDRSDDPSVSFQTPTKLSPNMAASAVASHESEHVRNEQGRAKREGREVTNQTVTFTYDICPECGRRYVSGGTTRTTTVEKPDTENAQESGKDSGIAAGGK